LQYPWPGNVRELENVMRRAMVLCTDHHVTPAHLMFDDWLTLAVPTAAPNPSPNAAPTPVHAFSEHPTAATAHPGPSFDAPAAADALPQWIAASNEPPQHTPPVAAPPDLQSAVRHNEHQVIMATLASTPSKTEAAKRLGISPRTLRYKMAQLREHGLSMAQAC
jgi:two-component system, response regulator FlrC